MTINFIILCVSSINWYPKQIIEWFTLSLAMAPATSKWKKIEHSITFISASKRVSRMSKSSVEIKKRSKWKTLRWDFRSKLDFLSDFSGISSRFPFICWGHYWLVLNQVIAKERPVPTPGVCQQSNLRRGCLQNGKKSKILSTSYPPRGEV